MEDLPIGSEITLKVVESETEECNGCFFCIEGTCYNPTRNDWADGFQCQPEDRSDGKSIIFKEVKE
jgi:uncharacterized Fe-S center protein